MTGYLTRILGAATMGAVSALALPAAAQQIDFGKAAFERNCSVCHGMSASGDGTVAELFAQKPKDLRLLSEENNGIFPFAEVYQAIDGRREIKGHGMSEMPVWGDHFTTEALPKTFHPGISADEIVQGRVLSLVYYLQTIQK